MYEPVVVRVSAPMTTPSLNCTAMIEVYVSARLLNGHTPRLTSPFLRWVIGTELMPSIVIGGEFVVVGSSIEPAVWPQRSEDERVCCE